jgi:hypothetical protein
LTRGKVTKKQEPDKGGVVIAAEVIVLKGLREIEKLRTY